MCQLHGTPTPGFLLALTSTQCVNARNQSLRKTLHSSKSVTVSGGNIAVSGIFPLIFSSISSENLFISSALRNWRKSSYKSHILLRCTAYAYGFDRKMSNGVLPATISSTHPFRSAVRPLGPLPQHFTSPKLNRATTPSLSLCSPSPAQ